MKKLFVTLVMSLCLSAIPTISHAETKEPVAYTVVIFEDGSFEIHEGNLSADEIEQIYRDHDRASK